MVIEKTHQKFSLNKASSNTQSIAEKCITTAFNINKNESIQKNLNGKILEYLKKLFPKVKTVQLVHPQSMTSLISSLLLSEQRKSTKTRLNCLVFRRLFCAVSLFRLFFGERTLRKNIFV